MESDDIAVEEVLAIIPTLNKCRIKQLISKFGSADEVINQFFDGNINENESEDKPNEVIEIGSDLTVSTINEDQDSFEVGGFEDGVITFSDRKIESLESRNSLHDGDDDLPDIPDVQIDYSHSVESLRLKNLSPQTSSSPPSTVKPKKSRNKKVNLAENNENLAKASKKKIPANVASIEVQLGAALLDKNLSSEPDLIDALMKALEVSGGTFEKNAALPCPCNVTLWSDPIHPYALRWVYHKPLSILEDDEVSNDGIYAAPGSDFCAEVQPEIGLMMPTENFVSLCRQSDGLVEFCRDLVSYCDIPFKRLIIITPDPEQYFKQNQSDQRKQFRKKMTEKSNTFSASSSEKIKLEDIETAIAAVDFAEPPIEFLLNVQYSMGNEHAAAVVRAMTKAISERPGKASKRQWDSALVMDPGSTVNPTEKPFELWLRQLEQVALVSNDVASAIASRYQTTMSLHCAACAEGPTFLANIEIRRGAGVLERTRRVGPECSRRLHMLYTSEANPSSILE